MLDAWEFEPKVWHASTINGRLIPPHPINMHGIAQDYDLSIPIVFYDPSDRWIKPGSYSQLAVQQDIVPTLSKILDVPVAPKNGGRALTESLRSPMPSEKPKAIVIFVQDQVGRDYYAAHQGKAPFYESLMAKGANYVNGSVAHVDVETSVGHAGIGTGAWPAEHGVAGNNLFHRGLWRQLSALGIQTTPSESSKKFVPLMFFTPAFSDVWSLSRNNKPVILSVSPAARASISMGGHGGLFNGGFRTYVTWLDDPGRVGQWTTEEDNYRLPQSFKNKNLFPWIKPIVDQNNSWRGHQLINADGKLNQMPAIASPALVRQQGELTRAAIQELKIGADDETDLIWVNTKSTDYCGHLFGYESEECAEVLGVADDEARKIVETVSQETNGSYLVVLTADHGAAPLPEVSGGYRVDRTKLKSDMNKAFDRKANNIDIIQTITSSQVFVNQGELAANNLTMKDLTEYLKNYKAKMESPYNVLADEWIKKGKPREAIFFDDVVAKGDLN